MPDVVQQRCRSDDCLFFFVDGYRLVGLTQQRQGATRKMMRTQRMLEARMRRTRIHQISPAQLSDVAKPLEDVGVDKLQGKLVDADVVPDGVAQNLEAD